MTGTLRSYIDRNNDIIKSHQESINKLHESNKKYEYRIATLEGIHYYVYLCKVDGIVRYIGKGCNDRYKHTLSGSSSCRELNRDLFMGSILEVFLYKDVNGDVFFEEDIALMYERQLIHTFEHHGVVLYNKDKVESDIIEVTDASITPIEGSIMEMYCRGVGYTT
jgi:hypothetical protein